MRFASLGSGSRGNATLLEAGKTRLLLDCGFSAVETERRLARLGVPPEGLSAILVTHEHGDHIGGVARLARRHRLPVWASAGTLAALPDRDVPRLESFSGHEPFTIGDIGVRPFPVPHDAREPCQFVFDDGARRLGVLTDTGEITPHIRRSLADCRGLLLECNHDVRMLAGGSYPPPLKARVGGRLGHLSNDQAAGLFSSLDCGRLQHVVAAHLSGQNNTPDLARRTLGAALDCAPEWIGVASQDEGLDWRQLR